MSRPKICLVMIVKDEEHVIGRCLRTLKPHVDCYVIMDTGSSDSTVEEIGKTMGDMPGHIPHEPFQSFRHNRTLALKTAREKFPDADYHLMMDADDMWIVEGNFQWPASMDRDAYNVKHKMGRISFDRPAILRATGKWRYEGAAHEHIVYGGPGRFTAGKIEGAFVRCGTDGHRRKTEGKSKYNRIAKILQEEVDKNPEDKRSTFYLAQSYRDAGENEKALKYYHLRSEMGGWQEEVWYSYYQIAEIMSRSDGDPDEIVKYYLKAYAYRPARAEALFSLASYHRNRREYALARVYSSAAKDIRLPKDRLFVDESVYTWRSLDEFCVASNKMGSIDDAKNAALKLLACSDVTDGNRVRIENNLTFSCRPITQPRVKGTPKVAVLLSTHDANAEELERSIQSIVDQTYQNWELIIVSDGDLTEPSLPKRFLEDPRIRLIHMMVNVGQFPIYDCVIRNVDAELIAIQDDDDISAPNRLERLVSEIKRTGADVVFSDMNVKTNGRTVLQPSHPEWLGEQEGQIVHAGSHVGLWRKASILAIGGYYGGLDIGADTLVVGLIARLGRPAFCHEPLYTAYREKDSMMRNEETGMSSTRRAHAWSKICQTWDSVRHSANPVATARTIVTKDANSKQLKSSGLVLADLNALIAEQLR
jgi:glycosyltransferase involved in cell wall biosynthesis